MLDRPTPARSLVAALLGAATLAAVFALPTALALRAGMDGETAGFLGLVALLLTADMALWAVGKAVDTAANRSGQQARAAAVQAKVQAQTTQAQRPRPDDPQA